MTFKVTVEHELDPQRVQDVVDNGLAWGLEWRQIIFSSGPDGEELENIFIGELEVGDWYEKYKKGTLKMVYDPDNGLHELTDAKLQNGLETLALDYPHLMTEILEENDDANTGDVLIQCALFGAEQYS